MDFYGIQNVFSIKFEISLHYIKKVIFFKNYFEYHVIFRQAKK